MKQKLKTAIRSIVPLDFFRKTRDSETFQATMRNAERYQAFIDDNRAEFRASFDHALEMAAVYEDEHREEMMKALDRASTALHNLKLLGFDLFSRRRMRQLHAKLSHGTPAQIRSIAAVVQSRHALQQSLLRDEVPHQERAEVAKNLRQLDTELVTKVAGTAERAMTQVNNVAMSAISRILLSSIRPIGYAADFVGGRMQAAKGIHQGGMVMRGLGHIVAGFLGRDALYRTGFETSWGFRAIIPGTEGFIGNIGPWVMFYSGTIRDYTTMAVPFRINPGVSLATDVGTLTQNRPGFGAGTATPIVSGYVDKARSKLLVGRDGYIYIRVGEWEGRGPYFTISAFIPVNPVIRITWNASVFSPGFAPLVRKLSPATLWVRAQSDWLWDKISGPFARMIKRWKR